MDYFIFIYVSGFPTLSDSLSEKILSYSKSKLPDQHARHQETREYGRKINRPELDVDYDFQRDSLPYEFFKNGLFLSPTFPLPGSQTWPGSWVTPMEMLEIIETQPLENIITSYSDGPLHSLILPGDIRLQGFQSPLIFSEDPQNTPKLRKVLKDVKSNFEDEYRSGQYLHATDEMDCYVLQFFGHVFSKSAGNIQITESIKLREKIQQLIHHFSPEYVFGISEFNIDCIAQSVGGTKLLKNWPLPRPWEFFWDFFAFKNSRFPHFQTYFTEIKKGAQLFRDQYIDSGFFMPTPI
jgi:hypothetical protein